MSSFDASSDITNNNHRQQCQQCQQRQVSRPTASRSILGLSWAYSGPCLGRVRVSEQRVNEALALALKLLSPPLVSAQLTSSEDGHMCRQRQA